MLCCIGDLVEDVVVWLSAEPARGTDTPARIFRRRGGSAANVAGLAVRAGGSSRFVGRVGDDPLGEQLAAQLAAGGVDVCAQRGGRTGTVVVLVDPTGERTMIPDRGAATELKNVDKAILDGVTWLHVPAYSLVVEPLAATSRALMIAAADRKIPISVDASSSAVLEDFGVERFRKILLDHAPDTVMCNKDEAGVLGASEGTPLAGVERTIIKAGAQPTMLIRPDGTTIVVPVPPEDRVVDTTGAGDAFAAGFIVARLQGANTAAAISDGHALAATVLRRPGADFDESGPVD